MEAKLSDSKIGVPILSEVKDDSGWLPSCMNRQIQVEIFQTVANGDWRGSGELSWIVPSDP
jgi:hypothetical protein